MPNYKYQEIVEGIKEDIRSGRYAPGARLPSESELVEKYRASRMTVVHAMKDLQALGLIDRRVGSGTFVREIEKSNHQIFGLLIPELGQTEIFEVICRGMMEAPGAKFTSLLWGNAMSAEGLYEEVAEQLCNQFIYQRVSGVFFAPVILTPACNEVNRKITTALDKAGIPIVLLDRYLGPYPARGRYDFVGIDNHRAGYFAAEHLIKHGSKRTAYFSISDAATTVQARENGYREALRLCGVREGQAHVYFGNASDQTYVQSLMKADRIDGFLCANDHIAGHLMHSLIALGYDVPNDVRIVGVDDVKYAKLLPVPLTTQHQPCRDIGKEAIALMLNRIANPEMPPRDVLLDCHLVVRQSCGATVPTPAKRKMAGAARQP